ncbi:gamma-glutamylcyclotransferase [Halomonas sp. MCCC 1A17488]|uniref:glutathione-specific gamma-glutamylcyclotransferase n=1 Tax=Billgrantia sulfidoxydans TaxID=2733484 RepID=A0ABX7W788_9GAMM|nr:MULTISPECIES: gamma-glutamylcyclotransferase [Halomonas]MCE8017591.1 gamma-glutamylcyclotransferase [Halomonas sp. MCCC 1A17488]MCG3240924.1 gamma-glutamylcyclotransferase [Halomonas sp. MCCC 1A17488]QPP48795.1 gamma-glutamylcyclotransferase [Halomonas sp. SS10-MC5]QTP56131.1 gamma-glutamylcyclotransferase [Halomonas sulfidoxydans]
MTLDTTQLNRERVFFETGQTLWLFGYGSLIWKAEFPFHERRPAHIEGWTRRFWQGSHDHRGTPEAPGRVATLVESSGACCQGMAYRIDADTLAPLDVREKNGYLRERITLHFHDGSHAEGLIYLATADNAAYLGHAPLDQMARQIATAEGPSGTNRDYLLNLAAALEDLGAEDSHVFELAERVTRLP